MYLPKNTTSKGISPLIGAVLLIAFTMAVAGLLATFFTSFTDDTTESVGNESERLVSCSTAQYQIANAYYRAETNDFVVTLANDHTSAFENITVAVWREERFQSRDYSGEIAGAETETVVIEEVMQQPDQVRTFSNRCPSIRKEKYLGPDNAVFRGYGKEFYFHTPPSSSSNTKIAVFGTENATQVTVYTDETQSEQFVMDDGYFSTTSTISDDTKVRIKSNQTVSAIAYGYCCGWNEYGLTALPDERTGKFTGTRFQGFRGKYSIISWADNTALNVTNSTGHTYEYTLAEGEHIRSSYMTSSDTADKAIRIRSNNSVSVLFGEKTNYGSYIPSRIRDITGKKFYGRTDDKLYIISQNDGTDVDLFNIDNGDQIESYENIGAGETRIQSYSGWYRVESNKRVAVKSTVPQSSCDGGDDVHIIGKITASISSLEMRAGTSFAVMAMEDEVDVRVGNESARLAKYDELWVDNLGRDGSVQQIEANGTALAYAYSSQASDCEGDSYDDWHTALTAVE